MFIEERQIAIEKVLREQGKVRTRELSEMFQVTEDCRTYTPRQDQWDSEAYPPA